MIEIFQSKAKQMPLEVLTLLGLRLFKKDTVVPHFYARVVISARNNLENWMPNILTWDDAAKFIKDFGGILLVNKYSARPHDSNKYYNYGELWKRNPSLAAMIPHIEGKRAADTITISSCAITINSETYEATFNINSNPQKLSSPTIADIQPDIEKAMIADFIKRTYGHDETYVSKLIADEYPPVQSPVVPPDDRKIACHCDFCGEDIFDDEEYYIESIDGKEKRYHEDCFMNKAATICLQAGVVKRNRSES